MSANIGFIGLGNMGGPMASNLLKAGHKVKVFDLMPAAVEKLAASGATVCQDAKQACDDVQVLISMLPASIHVENLYLGEAGILSSIAPQTLVVDCSTIAPETSRLVAANAAERGIQMLDAPVSGGVGGAVAATLTFIVGGEKAALELARPIFENMGKNIFHAGAAGAGQVAKFCNNMLLSVLMTGTAEALQLGVDNGLDAGVLSEIMRQSSGGNWALEVYNPYPGVMDNVPASKDYEGGFLVDLMIKDLGLAMEAALQQGASVPLGSLARNLYINHGKAGYGRKDFSSIQKIYNKDEPES
ncbi:MAG: 3-hydroxyisobutyrate dehydrogenase [Pseudomonadales bacterium]|nr:3-hydroxyisobutyrate dehydrogenase [Pseudomonadales bacterium]